MSDHECDFWRTSAGTLVCNCGKSKQPIAQPADESEGEKP